MYRLTSFCEGGWCNEITARTGKIWTLCIYDDQKRTHLCEITPSYELWPVAAVFEHPAAFPPNGNESGCSVEQPVDDEDLQDECDRCVGDDGGPFYVHCHEVEQGAPLPELETDEYTEEEAAGELRSNPPNVEVVNGELRVA